MKIQIYICEKIEAWLEQYEGRDKSVIDLYLNCLADTPPDDKFNICGNTMKVWRDDFFSVVYIETLELESDDANAYITKHFSKNTPYRYVNFDDEKKIITYCAIVCVNDKEYTQDFFRKAMGNTSNSLDCSKPTDVEI